MSHGARSNRFQALGVAAGMTALALCAAPTPAAAQAEIGRIVFSGPGSGGNFGSNFAGLGDVNGDGHGDVVVGDDGTGDFGAVRIYSGADLSVIQEWFGDAVHDSFGNSVDSAGDVDGDGIEDVLLGAYGADLTGPSSGLVRVHSSATGELLHEFSGLAADDLFGTVVAGLGDLDGDGRGDFAASGIAATGPGGEAHAGSVRVFSGADGQQLAWIRGWTDEQWLGSNVRPAGDFNADGTPDLVVISGPTSDWRLLVYSGAWIVSRTGPAVLLDLADGSFALAVDAAGDIDLDGWDDLVLGTPYVASDPQVGGWRVISGQDHTLLFDWVGSVPGTTVGTRVAGAGDLDQDGYPDVLVHEYMEVAPFGFTKAYSGRDASVLYTCTLVPGIEPGAEALAGVGDVNADGYLDWGVGQAPAGLITLFSPAGIWDDLGHGLAGTMGVPALSGAGLLLGGDAMSVALEGALPDQPFVLVVGLSAVYLPFRGGVFVPDAGLLVFGTTDGNGGRQWSDTWPLGVPALSFYFQVWMQDPLGVEGWAASNGLRAQSP